MNEWMRFMGDWKNEMQRTERIIIKKKERNECNLPSIYQNKFEFL